ncbi:hypothetical protein QR680_006806 [Steinernema hermaphroditum]|uniref:Uncharacterized protein n=1 Tax=Steinernema hermaphroditum TaxID=289476 RepID=A0AA39HWJ1_9BILA|nr:hypothetical protein QR680_006806 [Steinernema hermaphroditum]
MQQREWSAGLSALREFSKIYRTTLAPKIKKLNRNTQQNVRNAKRDGPKTLFTAQEIAHAKPFERSDTVVICSEAFQRLLKPKKSGKKWTTVAEGLYPGVTIVPTGAMVKNLANLIAKSTKPWHHVNNLILFIGCDDLMKSSEQFLKNDFRDLITNVKERMELTQTDLTRSDARLYVVLLPEFGAKGAQAKAINDYLKNESTEGTDMVVTLVEMQLGEIAQKHPGFFSKQKPWQIAHHVAEQIVSNILEKEEISWSKKKLCGMAKATVNNQQNQDSTVIGSRQRK